MAFGEIMLTCDKRILWGVPKIIVLSSLMGLIIAINLISSKYVFSVLICWAVILLSALAITMLYFRKRRNKKILDSITCGEVTDTLIFLEALAYSYYTVRRILKRISIRNVESCLDKMTKISPEAAMGIHSFITTYGILEELKSRRTKIVFFRILMWLIIISAPIILLILLVITRNVYISGIVFFSIVFIGGLLAYIEAQESACSLPIYSRITVSQIEHLRSLISKLIYEVSERLREPIYLELSLEHPMIKYWRGFAVLQTKQG